MERKRRFQTRQQYAEQKANESKFDKVNHYLNYLIAIVAVLIIFTLWFILSKDSKPDTDVAEAPEQAETVDKDTNTSSNEENEDSPSEEGESETATSDDETTDETTNQASETIVNSSSDPTVSEVQTNPDWQAYPTEQTGEHVSAFEKGNIDYEEKLKAIFSVIDLQQENSIVLSVRNNGNTKSAIAVVTSMDKEKKYRVSIEWIDGEGWKPVQLEVLNSLDGVN
ncbi:hypothetical protein DCE79_12325 [Lysinibacillus sp. 2017]|uniref:YrrS family protein n=1 Tax=unclassified Lysinibacillus TaxID=2636778 RepID=UPI000D5257F7|nr:MULTISPECIES: YrrS family protein [unclassified Lysinibacillus]AWE08129.1 hypothetical protein DCE79_12325 [Lysinibacillus sp. 2017]TGN36367.1 DUF1510 family protein [Lysinibacillus sp. S2017]